MGRAPGGKEMKEAIIYLTVIIVIMAWVGLTVIIASRSYINGFNEGYEFGKEAKDEDNNKPH